MSSEWLPIEIAPKDPRVSLLLASNSNSWVSIGSWAPYMGCVWVNDHEEKLQGPTHWMPLPSPPPLCEPNTKG